MPTATNGKAQTKETWRDWLPPGTKINPEALLTRDQLLSRLKRHHVDATTSDLRYWEYEGVVPRPVRQWHNGAVRATYAPWLVDVITRLREMQSEGATLSDIAPRLRGMVRARYSDDPIDVEIRKHSDNQAHGPRGPESLLPTWELSREITKLADWHARITGVSTDRVEIRVFSTDGNWTKYPFPIASTETADEQDNEVVSH